MKRSPALSQLHGFISRCHLWLVLALLCLCLCPPSPAVSQTQVLQEAFLKAQFPTEQGQFGYSVSLSGNTLVVGVPFESGGFAGVNSREGDRSKTFSGAAFVFVRRGDQWFREAYLKASNPDAKDLFGWQVAIDGDSIAVLAFDECSAALGINGDQRNNSYRPRYGNVLPPTAAARGAIYVFTRANGAWTQQAYIKPPNQESFFSNISLSGDCLVVGSHVLVREAAVWRYHSKLEPTVPEGITGRVAHTIVRGDTIVAAGFEAAANLSRVANSDTARMGYLFVRKGDAWVQEARLPLPGTAPVAGVNVGCNEAQDMIVFALSFAQYGTDLSMIQDKGSPWAKVPSPHYRGAALVFRREGSEWKPMATLTGDEVPANSTAGTFGSSVAMEGKYLLISDPLDSRSGTGVNPRPGPGGASSSGAAYLFELIDGQWKRSAYLKPHRVMKAGFGHSVALSGTTLVCGAPKESSDAKGINGKSSSEVAAETQGDRGPSTGTKMAKRGLAPEGIAYSGAAYVLSLRPGSAASE